MGFDAKCIQILVCKAVKFSVTSFSSFVRKHPVVSSVFSLLFLLYLFLTSVFYFLLYSLPFVACTLVFIYFYFFYKRPGIQNVETYHVRQAPFEKPEADVVKVNRDDNFPIESRNVKGEGEEFVVRESKDMLVEKAFTDDSAKETFLTEEKSRAAAKDIGTSSCKNDHVGEKSSVIRTGSDASLVDQVSKLQGSGEIEIESSSSGDDEDEEVQQATNKAVEWTEADQKNLMNLGISELERNSRLESLIARRRAEKSKNPIQKMLNMNNAHPLATVPRVLITKTNPFDIPSSAEPTPGSAPSVLSQTRNPFDFPYDPIEEKSDLMADGFQQDFKPKDMFFCRHESFLLGPSFPVLDIIQDPQEGLGFSRVKRTLDNDEHDRVVDDPLLRGGVTLRRTLSVTDLVTEEGESLEQALNNAEVSDKDINSEEKFENINDMKSNSGGGNEIQKAADLAKPMKIGSSGSDVDDDQEATFNENTFGITENIHVTGFEFPEVLPNSANIPIPCPIPKGRVIGEPIYDSLPSPIDKSMAEEQTFLGTKAPWHTPTNSIASDLQVEVSELGSPRSTADGAGSSCDGDSLTYEVDVDKEVIPCELKLDQDQLTSKQEYKAGEDDATREQLSYIQKALDNPVASFMNPLPSSATVEASEVVREPFNPSDNLSKEATENRGVEDMKPVEVGIHGNETSVNEKSLPSEETKPESINATEHKSLSSPEKKQGRITNTETESLVNENNRIEDLTSKENRNATTGKSHNQEALACSSETPQEGTSKFSKTAESTSREPANIPTTIYEQSQNISSPLEARHGGEEQEINREVAEFVAAGLSQMSDNPATQLDLLAELVSTNSSTSDSPKSVLPDISPREQTPSSVFTQQMDIPVLESDQQSDEVRNGLTGHDVHENAGLISRENSQDAKENERIGETSNAKFTTELPEQPEETNTVSAQHIESNLVANSADIGEELLSQNPIAQADIIYNIDEPLTRAIASNDNLTSSGSNADGNHESNTLNKPKTIAERSEASETRNSEPTKDTIKDPKEDAVNDIPSLLVNLVNSSTDHTTNFEDRRELLPDETDADKSGETNDSLKFNNKSDETGNGIS